MPAAGARPPLPHVRPPASSSAQPTARSYDASAHLTEETRDAGRSGPRGIIMTVVCSFVVGWLYLFSLTFSIQARFAEGCECVCVSGFAGLASGVVCMGPRQPRRRTRRSPAYLHQARHLPQAPAANHFHT